MKKEYTYKNKSLKTRQRPIKFIKKATCHICTSHAKDRDGYPKTSFNIGYKQNGMILMHKFIYIDFYLNGENAIPKGNHVMHTCNNHDCINPEHLQLGTIHDHIPKLKGEQRKQSKLTEKDVLAIRAATDTTNLKLAKIYGVSDRAIGKIKNRESWTHI